MNLGNLNQETVWLFLVVVFIVVEVVTAGSLISIWFCFGSLAAMVAARSNTNIIVQMVVFLVVSTAFLVITKPFVKKILKQKNEPTNLDAIIGHVGIVTETIDNRLETGTVKISGKLWTARSTHQHDIIAVGEQVEVVKIEGVKLYVKNIKESKTI
ncbi:MAG: NfeD family protein [Anaerotignaceae bacterium]